MVLKSVIAVIDIGKTNAKVACVDTKDLKEIAVVTQPNHVLLAPPYPHFAVEEIYQFVINSLKEFAKEFDVYAISVTTHGASCALLNEDGELVTPVMDYEFDGLQSTSVKYDGVRPGFDETGSPKLAAGLNLGAQIFWLFENFPETKKLTKQIVTYAQYWSFRLSGIARNELTSLGCHTDLWNPVEAQFSSMVGELGWLDMMAPVAKANEILGPILPELSTKTGLHPKVPVYCGIHDSNASLLPHLKSNNRSISVVSTGTWVVAMAVGGKRIDLDPSRDTLINVNGLGEPVPSARFMGGREFEILMANRKSDFDIKDVEFILQNQVMILPSVVQNSGPFPSHAYQWTSDPNQLGEGQYFVAVSFYLALMTASCLTLIGSEGKIIVEGPFSKNNLYCEMLATAMSQPVNPSLGTGTSVGAAMLTLEKVNLTKSYNAKQHNALPEFKDYAEMWSALVNTKQH